MPEPDHSAEAIAWLRAPEAIRARCGEIFALVEGDGSAHLTLDLLAMDGAADLVAATIRRNFPDLAVPPHSRWRHFAAGGIDRWGRLAGDIAELPPAEIARLRIDLAVTSVLLDAGAGAAWRYREPGGGVYARSEGLAVAGFHLFAAGAFSSDAATPLRADSAGLARFDAAALQAGLQVDSANPLDGADGRAGLLQRLGAALAASPDLFGAAVPRPGHLFDYLAGNAAGGAIAAPDILAALLRGLAPIWPARTTLGGVNLGDVWPHAAIRADDATDGLVPFHKLSQWLAYSLIEPLEDAGLAVAGVDALTGLAEYRNGGLFIDTGVVRARDEALLTAPQAPGAEAVVEWRALTVALLDRLAPMVRERLDVDAEGLPFPALLEGGTWRAGRDIAARLRPDGGPPIHVLSDGTVM